MTFTERRAPAAPDPDATRLGWVQTADDAPYFVQENGAAFTPVGQNDAISWVELKGLLRRRDLPSVERHLRWLRDHGVTVLRLMLEYAEGRSHYFERPAGRFNPALVQLWDDAIALCERLGLRLLLTPFDTFWTWLAWDHHPYNRANGGPLDHPSRLLLDADTRTLIKNRLTFAADRWGGSGAVFAWDLWNEIHPAQAEGRAEVFDAFISDLSGTVRQVELARFGRSHPQTVSLFSPELDLQPHLDLAGPIFRHPDLDFASLHVYSRGAIDNPRNTVDAALAMGAITRRALGEIRDARPFFDSEHGPIHTFKDRELTLPEAFDDEYFRHMQWAHLASGGAGGGMRWPNRHPHVLTRGMRRAQSALSRFLPLIDWPRFQRRNLNREIVSSHREVAVFGCGDAQQAVVWLLRRGPQTADGSLDPAAAAIHTLVRVPGLAPGRYRVTAWRTDLGEAAGSWEIPTERRALIFEPPGFSADLALAIRKVG
jgi:hypothetical protein